VGPLIWVFIVENDRDGDDNDNKDDNNSEDDKNNNDDKNSNVKEEDNTCSPTKNNKNANTAW
jgi:hypothetical protein